MITAKEFKEKVGYAPVHDDLERANCSEAGKIGHFACGWCTDHDKPHSVCGCFLVHFIGPLRVVENNNDSKSI